MQETEKLKDRQKTELLVPEEYHLERIDKFLTCSLELDISRTFIQKIIASGGILVNGLPVKANYKLKTDDLISVQIPEPDSADIKPENISLDIVYEDSSIIVINKQPGLVVHPGHGNWDKTLVNALMFHCKDLSSIGGAIRPGIVHRLDKDTAGLMVAAKNDVSHKNLAEAFSGRKVRKEYSAIVTGRPPANSAVISKPLARHRKYRHKMTVDETGREAVSEYRLKKLWNTGQYIFSLLSVQIHTGRTHQIRVHLSSSGLPIVGDPAYSKKWDRYRVPYLLLASVRLAFAHPETGEELSFNIPLPAHMQDFIRRLENSDSWDAEE